MATRPGEDLAATLFADVHYYYGSPTAKPPHHRFDKGSYVYLFENATQRRARIEIANNAGTAEQDATTGYLDGTHIRYSYTHSCLVSVTVESIQNGQNPPLADPQEWHLPTYDPRNEKKYMYKLHTLDIYFWNKEDALQFVNGLRRVLSPFQIIIENEPRAPSPHTEPMSPVVQQLENVAITDPSYAHGQTRDSRTTSSFPGPPISATPSGSSNSTFPGPPISATPRSVEASNFAPLAYNPAAPAAPEAIKHREKTPPPEDGAANPLVAAAASDHGQTYGGPFQQPGLSSPPLQTSYFPGPPTAGFQSAFHQQLPSAGLQSPHGQLSSINTFSPPPSSIASNVSNPPSAQSHMSPSYQSTGNHVPVTQYANYPGSPGFAPPSATSSGIYSPGLPGPPSAPPAHMAPPGGFSNYTYGSTSGMSSTQPLVNDYSIHKQLYRPTESEAAVKYKEKKPPAGKLEAKANNVEKKVGGFLKKLEKKYG
ncbi:hypothetical protein BP5796_03149 [Coleophoma crateriformis]|uniref:RNA recognition motif-containing protein n=1 Tax=Coleophoma crateriformis TaxID=565419 RepID=A0A3D8SMA9_9HELO|nr:hypothetical protein BP5796_03149 [Coleophoma crateriformis]